MDSPHQMPSKTTSMFAKVTSLAKSCLVISIIGIVVVFVGLYYLFSKYFNTENKDLPQTSITINEIDYELAEVKGGTFTMGDIFDDPEAESYEKPLHSVTLKDFYIGKYEVSQAQWEKIMGENPSKFKGCATCPVEQVTWEEVQVFLQKLNQKVKPQLPFRLPTEAEWQFAARNRGQKVRFGNNKDTLKPDEANFYADITKKKPYSLAGKTIGKTTPIGSFAPNSLGLYDMAGNVWEWCSDWYDSTYYQYSPAIDPQGATTGEYKVKCGGSWDDVPQNLRVAIRGEDYPNKKRSYIGFRICRSK